MQGFTLAFSTSSAMSLDEKKDTKVEGGYVVETTSDDDLPSYEDAAVTTGAPTEKVSPLGYHVDWISVIFLVGSHHLVIGL